MRSAGPPPAMLFDLDGTLVDTVPARIEAWAVTFEAFGIAAARRQLEPTIGMDGRRLAIEVAAAAGRELTDDEAEAIDRAAGEAFDERNRAPLPLPGAREALDMLDRAGITWAIATSSRREQIGASTAALGLDGTARIVDGSHVAHAKPAPDLLLLAARELGLSPVGLWYVGDSTWDIRAADAAEMLPIGVLAGSAVDAATLHDAGAAVVWRTLQDLLELAWA